MQVQCFILLTLATVVQASADQDAVYCDVAEHKYFVKQWGQCKSCDRCPVGYGVPSAKTMEIDMDPVHGALSCLGCEKCVPGKTFNSNIGYEGCWKCTNCSEKGLYEEIQCTRTKNTKCENRYAAQKPAETKENIDYKNKDSALETVIPDELYLIIVFVVTLTAVPAVAFVVVRRQGGHCIKTIKSKVTSDEEERLDTRPTVDNNQYSIQIATVVGSKHSSTVHSPVHSQESDMMLEKSDLDEEDLTADCRDNGHKDRVITEQDIQAVCSDLAHNNIYCELCRVLGVPDNAIQIIKEECKPDLKESAFQCLKKWLELKVQAATIREFERGLRQIRRDGIIDKLKHKYSH